MDLAPWDRSSAAVSIDDVPGSAHSHDVNDGKLVRTGNLLDEFIENGVYAPNSPFSSTSSSLRLYQRTTPRASDPDFVTAKKKKVDGLESRGIWRVVNEVDIPRGANVLGARFVLKLKNYGTPSEMAKARHVAQGYNDFEKSFIVHDGNTLRQDSCRMIVSIAAVKGFRLFGYDVTQAYLQVLDKLTRRIFIRPKDREMDTFKLSDGQLLEMVKPLYGICDAGDYWGVTFDRHLTNDLCMTPAKSYGELYMREKNDAAKDTKGVIGVTGVYVDDCLNDGDEMFQKEMEQALRTFESKPRA